MQADAALDADPLVGKTIDGRYAIVRLIGHGGMGKVFEAEHIGLGKRVAIKLIADTADADLRTRLRREARAASRVVHEHVVAVFDVGAEDDRDFIVMEYIAGRDLDAVIADGPLPVARAIAIAQQILRGLAACHAAGIVHRDIKPGNIRLATGTDAVKIMDFGIARATDARRATDTGHAIGTPQFMAPEQVVAGVVDHRADLYAVGATLFAMLAGAPPFADTGYTARLEAPARPPASLTALAPNVPPALAAVVTRALASEPEDRYPDATAFLAALDDCARKAAARADAATRPLGDARPAAAATGRRWRPLAAAAAVAALALALGYLVGSRRTGEPVPAPRDAATTAPPRHRHRYPRWSPRRHHRWMPLSTHRHRRRSRHASAQRRPRGRKIRTRRSAGARSGPPRGCSRTRACAR